MKRQLSERLIVALDVQTFSHAKKVVELLLPAVRIFKVGAQLFTASGPEVILMIQKKGAKVFLDLKYHDIPHTVARAVEVATGLGVFMISLHAQGGLKMLRRTLEAARVKAKEKKITRPLLLGVTVLTSMEQTDFLQLGIGREIDKQVLHLTRLSLKAGLDGVVSSCREAALIRRNFGDRPIIVAPGIRPIKIECDDQKRIATPQEAIRAGVDYIVVGRPILEAEDPLKEAERIKALW